MFVVVAALFEVLGRGIGKTAGRVEVVVQEAEQSWVLQYLK